MMNPRFYIPRWAPLLLLLAGNCPAAYEEAAQALQAKDYAAALQQLEEVPEAQREDPQWQLLQAASEAGSGDLKGAEARYLALISQSPKLPEAYNNLAALYARQGRLDEAMELLEQAMKTNESYATVYANLRNIYYEMSRTAYARALQMEQRKDGPALQPILTVAAAPQPVVVPEQVASEVVTAQTETEEAPLQPPEAVNVALVAVEGVVPQPLPVPETVVEVAEEADVNMTAKAIPEAVMDAAVEAGAPSQAAIIAMLNRWATDWAGQQVEGYLDAYAEAFQPGQGMAREQWEAQRRQRLARPESIEVQLGDFDIQFRGDDRASVTLVQYYRSERYSDTVRKRFQLIRTGDSWKILTEKTIEVL